jgi:hypothetical protein
MPKRIDLLLVAALLVVVAAIAGDALRHRRHAPPAAAPVVPSAPAPVPEQVRLVPSTTAFLPRCAASAIRLTVGPGALLTLRYAGRPCHVPPLHLQAVVRKPDGAVAYRGPALSYESLSGNYAGEGTAHGRLLGCPGAALVTGSGLSASGRC